MKFYVITATHNFSRWIEGNINALKSQTYGNFECVLVDDMSTDNTVNCARAAIGGDPRFKVYANETRKFKGRNVYEAIENTNAVDEDVIVMIDGDDMLADNNVFVKLKSVYQNTGCWMTYGSFIKSNGKFEKKNNRAYDGDIIKKNTYRKHRWLASHLKTFKYGLWRKIRPDAFFITEREYRQALLCALVKGRFRALNHWRKISLEDLHDNSGRFIRTLDDKAFTFPMLEMAGDKAVFISDILYVYNVDNSRMSKSIYGNQHKKWPERLVRDILRRKKAYARLYSLDCHD